MLHYTRRRNPHGYLSTLDISEFGKEVEALSANYDQWIVERMMPAWFLKSVDRRRIQVGRAKDNVRIDGQLTEATWSSAQPASNFIHQERLQLESRGTRTRIAFDDTHLYVAFECYEPSGDERITFGIAGHKGSTESRHWIVGQNASTAPPRSIIVKDGQPVIFENGSSTTTIKTSTGAGVWIVEMAIPLNELGFKIAPGSTCLTQLARQSKAEPVAFAFLHGDPVYERNRFAQTSFTDDRAPRTPVQISLNLGTPAMRHETIGSGSGTVIGGQLSLLTDRPLHQVRVLVETTDGIRPLGNKSFLPVKRVPLIWRPDAPFAMRFPEEVPGIVARFTVTADEGEWSFSRRFGSPRRSEEPPADLFTDGLGEGKALNHPAHFSSVGPAETPWPEGTIEFWIRPNWKSVPRLEGPRGGMEHALIHMGPIRPDHPTLSNVNSLALYYSSSGYLAGTLASSRYRHRSASTSVRDWQPGDWHHVARQWKLDDGGTTTVQLYLDGKLATKETHASPKDTASEPLVSKSFRPPIQIGSMNNGVRPADAAIDELRISFVRCYAASFQPGKRLSPDPHTLALFHFDGDLKAEVPSDLQATAGAAQ